MVEIQQVIDDIDSYSCEDVRRLQSAINDRLCKEESDAEREREFQEELLRKGIISRIPDRSKATPADQRAAAIPVKGQPVSQTIVEERR